jgi:tetratricopeptide (TPR) repeat protein
MTTMRSMAPAMLALALLFASAPLASANPRSEALAREGYDAAYNMDYDRAVELFRQAVTADPGDAAAWRGSASVSWLRVLFLRGTVLVEDYLGRLKNANDIDLPAPPPALNAAFHDSIDRAITIAEKSVARHESEAWAHYDLSASLGIAASYVGSVEGRLYTAMKLARRAVSEGDMVVKLDPTRKEAGLILGTYRYVVSTLPVAVRWMAYVVGFSSGKDEGLRQIEAAANHPSDVQTDARFALVLLYNRERRYVEALNVVRDLERTYPHNRLLQLEEASTALRGGKPAEALKVLDESMARMREDTRPRMPGEVARWFLKRGIARLQLGMVPEAEEDLRAAIGQRDVRSWVQARIHVASGKAADLRGDRAKAQSEYRTALSINKTAEDDEVENEATRYLASPYKR